MGFGNQIRKAREAKGLTQKDLADRIGVTASAVTNYENETSHPKKEVLYRMFEALDVDANYLYRDAIAPGFDAFTYAMSDESRELTDEDKKILLDMAAILKERRRAERS